MDLTGWAAPLGSRRRRWAGTVLRTLRGGPARRPHAPQVAPPRAATAWADDPRTLDEYAVSGYANPRINPQAALTRHTLIRMLFPDEFEDLMRQELEFCTEAVDAIWRRARELEVKMGTFPNPRKRARVDDVCRSIAHWEPTYEWWWARGLCDRDAGPLQVLELGCGSANHYRFLDSYGIARFLDYTGMDPHPVAIDNARNRHPNVRFEVGDVRDLPYPDRSVDVVVAADLFAYLPLADLGRALHETLRVARRRAVINFVRMADLPEHRERRKRNGFCNVLSAPMVAALLEEYGPTSMTHITSLLAKQVAYQAWPRKHAWTAIVDREASDLTRVE
jgi:SAM-dependent methyltransferase